MVNVQLQGIAAPDRAAPRTRRISPSGFWLLFGVEGIVLAAALLFALNLVLPTHVPLARSGDYTLVRDAIWSRLNGATDDPLIEVSPGVTARASSVRGFSLNGETYYYYLEGRRGFDPLSRGAVGKDAVEIVLRDDGGPKVLVIYRLLHG